uniref:FadR/GntR family transcriptional regulator n=1 Tax=Pararhizobium sp. IMCC3301 TaxID=3067904 RepID=UPI00274059D8|nr:FadR/GntR family transcriptional regulator [Pararhizobium sp. IMCC3301]
MKTQKTIGQVLNFIRERKYESGERLLSERDFAQKLGTTRQYVREAITALEAMRVVERRPSSGIYLRDLNSESSFEALVLHADTGVPLQPKEVADALETRRVLEVQAVTLACARHTDADLAKLERNLSATRARLDKSESIELEDREFHQLIVASTGNHVLVRLVNAFYEMSQLRRKLFFADQSRCLRSFEEHSRIFSAIRERDADRASEAIDAHLSQTVATWEKLLTSGSDAVE